MKTTSLFPRLLLAIFAMAALLAPVPSHATFMVDPDPFHTGNDTKFYLDGKHDGVTSFSGHVGDQDSGPVVGVTTNSGSTVDVANGYSTIKQATGLFTSLTFTPTGGVHFGDFSFRFMFDSSSPSQTVNVLVNANDGPFSFNYVFPAVTGDLGPIGVISLDGEWIESVIISTALGFKQVKQIDFSPATEPAPIPEPSTMLLLGAGFVGLAIYGKRSKKV